MDPAPLEPLPDDELVRRGQGGDEAALVELYHRYRPRVMAFATRMTGDPDLAEEVFCGTFAAFFGSLHRYVPTGRLAAYMFQVARTKIADELSARGRLATRLPSADEPTDDCLEELAPPPDLAACNSELTDLARRALAGLPVSLREVVILRVFEGLDYAAIGSITGTGTATARSRMRYALQVLRRTLPV